MISSALTLLILSGCGPSGVAKKLPPLPADLRKCFDTTVSAPSPGGMTKAQIVALISALKRSETAKTDCGKRLIKLYEKALSNG